ncbi:MAG TPA: dephospho-CoA kinase [Alphaproteobacteria bacterium]|nr:dephospho-CoA kinase [Alphaproteobacteria bacterium]
MIVLGVTGSIGMGKSTVSNMLSEMGIPVHDADATVHKLLAAGGKGVQPVAALFPDSLAQDANGQDMIDRAALGKIVFADPAKKKQLEDILHPMVRDDSAAFKAEMEKAGHKVIVFDIPLLFETGGESRVDAVLCVSAAADVQKARVLARPGMTEERFKHVLSQQLPDAEKRARADYVVTTDISFDDTRAQLKTVLEKIQPPRKPQVPPPANGCH